MNNNNWYNIVTTFNNGINQLYVNGVYVGQRTGLSLTAYTTTYYYFIGAGYSGSRGLGSNYFNGNISYFSFYNRVLTNSEIQQNFDALRVRFDL